MASSPFPDRRTTVLAFRKFAQEIIAIVPEYVPIPPKDETVPYVVADDTPVCPYTGVEYEN